MGGRIASTLQEVLNDNKTLTGYCEPFCGGCGVLSHMTSLEGLTFIAGDANKSIICMWKSLCEGWEPDITDATRERYAELKGNGASSAEKGFLGHVVSYGGLYFKTFTDSLVSRLPSSKASVINISRKVTNVEFSAGDYTQFSGLENNLIFCDPPYEKNSRYFDEFNNKMNFDSDTFWEWCIEMASSNNVVVVNEMSDIPDKIGWKKMSLPGRKVKYKDTLTTSDECLYILDSGSCPD